MLKQVEPLNDNKDYDEIIEQTRRYNPEIAEYLQEVRGNLHEVRSTTEF